MSRSDWVLMTLVIVIVVLGIWAAFFGPCWLYSFAPAGQVPARCIGGFVQ